MVLNALVNDELYPIEKPRSRLYAERVAKVRRELLDSGCAILPGFLSASGLAACRAVTQCLAPEAGERLRHTNPYGTGDSPELPAGHPRRRLLERSNAFVAGDRIATDSALRRLYTARALRTFLADCLGIARLHCYADPLADLVVNLLRPGCTHPWHFDNNDFIVTLLTQGPEAGGLFEYCPRLRRPNDENYPAVSAVLDGDRAPVRQLRLVPGDLQLFHGRYALHRVTPVEGRRDRHSVILAYSDRPGVIADPERTRRLFGRASEAHEQAARAGRSLAAHDRGAA